MGLTCNSKWMTNVSEGGGGFDHLEEPMGSQGIRPELVREELVENGGFLARAMAMVMDLLIIIVLQVGCLVIPIAALLQGEFSIQMILGSFFICVVLVFLSPFLALLYFVLLHGSLGQTLGKMLMGVCVVSSDGNKITVGVAFLRAIGFLFSVIPCGLGLLWVLADRQGRAWHDHLAMTRVIRLN